MCSSCDKTGTRYKWERRGEDPCSHPLSPRSPLFAKSKHVFSPKVPSISPHEQFKSACTEKGERGAHSECAGRGRERTKGETRSPHPLPSSPRQRAVCVTLSLLNTAPPSHLGRRTLHHSFFHRKKKNKKMTKRRSDAIWSFFHIAVGCFM